MSVLRPSSVAPPLRQGASSSSSSSSSLPSLSSCKRKQGREKKKAATERGKAEKGEERREEGCVTSFSSFPPRSLHLLFLCNLPLTAPGGGGRGEEGDGFDKVSKLSIRNA